METVGFLREWLTWCWLYLQHTFVMMYWITLPGLLVAATLSLRYRAALLGALLKRRAGSGAGLGAIALGLLDGDAGHPARRRTFEDLIARGLSHTSALAYLVAAQAFPLPVIGLFIVLVGLEFGLGLLVAGLVMTGLVALGVGLFGLGAAVPARGGQAWSPGPKEAAGVWSWASLSGSAAGWAATVRWVGRVFESQWLPSVAGLIAGGLVLALDMREAWIFPAWLGEETWGAALVSALVAPVLATVAFLSPLGNLVVASSLWKTWTHAYPGVLSFALAAAFNPPTLRMLSTQYGTRTTGRLGLFLYLGACLGGLAVPVVWRLLGLEVTHVPWFRDLVDRVVMALPFTMLGAAGLPGGATVSR